MRRYNNALLSAKEALRRIDVGLNGDTNGDGNGRDGNGNRDRDRKFTEVEKRELEELVKRCEGKI